MTGVSLGDGTVVLGGIGCWLLGHFLCRESWSPLRCHLKHPGNQPSHRKRLGSSPLEVLPTPVSCCHPWGSFGAAGLLASPRLVSEEPDRVGTSASGRGSVSTKVVACAVAPACRFPQISPRSRNGDRRGLLAPAPSVTPSPVVFALSP